MNLFGLTDKDLNEKLNYQGKHKIDSSVFELTDIMRIVAMEKKNIAIKVTNENSIGVIVFKNGDPIYSKLNKNNKTILKGIEAAYKILSWNKPTFKLAYLSKDVSNNLNTNLMNLLMGAMQYKDELLAKEQKDNLRKHLKGMEEVKGFIAVSIFTASGEMLEGINNDPNIRQELAGSAINDVLLNAQEVTDSMDLGYSDFLQIDAAKGIMVARCFNKDGAHFHTVLFLKKDGNIAMGKMLLTKTIDGLAKEF